jgi:hypothetical protein
MCFYAFLSDLSKKAYRKSIALMGMASFFCKKKTEWTAGRSLSKNA